MTQEPEQILENKLVTLLESMGYKKAAIHKEKDLLSNLKTQLEIHNKISLTDNEFTQILNYINKGNIFERAKIVRDRVPYINEIHWCQNQFQVTSQVTMQGKYKNRYDVTLLINGCHWFKLN